MSSGAAGRKFKSCHPDQYLQGATFPGRSFFLFSGPCLVLEASLSDNLSVQGCSVGMFRGVVSSAGLLWYIEGTITEEQSFAFHEFHSIVKIALELQQCEL